MQPIDWQPMNPVDPPSCKGVYGIKDETTGEWFYIGRAQNIAARLKGYQHPVHIAISLSRKYSYWFIECLNERKLESALIRELDPLGNGGTCFHGSSLRRLEVAPLGHYCVFENEADRASDYEILSLYLAKIDA